MSTITVKLGDRLPVIRLKLTSDGDAVDLTGANVTLRARGRDGTLVINAAMTIDDATAGIVSYTLATADTDTAGEFDCEVVVVDSSDLQSTYPADGYFRLIIFPSLATA